LGGNRHPTTFLPDDPKNAPWEEEIGNVKQFFTALEYWKLEPHDELLQCAASRTSDRVTRVDVGGRGLTLNQAPVTTYWCLADPGRVYAIYIRGTTERVSLQKMAAGSWIVERHDPRNGAKHIVTSMTEKGRIQLTSPDAQDWAFVVRRG
jgi:hypothetical protein